MGYNFSVASVIKAQSWLDVLHKNKSPTLTFMTDDPINLLFILNQGAAVAERLNVPPYEKLRKNYRFKVIGNSIICKRRVEAPTDIRAVVDYPNVVDTLDLLDTYVTHKSDGVEMRFPNIIQDESLAAWLVDKPHTWEDGVLYVKPVL